MNDKEEIVVETFLKLQGVRTKTDNYVRVVIPAKIARENDLVPGDQIRMVIVDHIKAGRMNAEKKPFSPARKSLRVMGWKEKAKAIFRKAMIGEEKAKAKE